MSEPWRQPTPPAPDYAPLMRSADDENFFDLEPQHGVVQRKLRAAGRPFFLILAALGGVGLIVLAFV